MSATLAEAVLALQSRKDALFEETARTIDADQMRLLCLGLELDQDELRGLGAAYAQTFMVSLASGACPDVFTAFRSLWADGVICGLLLAEQRAIVEARAREAGS